MKGRKLKRYDEAFKLGAVKLVVEEKQSVPNVAKNLGVSDKTLYVWVSKAQKQSEFCGKREDGFPGSGKRNASNDRLLQLERENRLLKMERDLLKKTMGFFVERPE